MAILRYNDIKKMDQKEKEKRMKDLSLELIKAKVTANKTNAKTKEIKRAIARLMTFNSSSEKLKKK